MCKPKPSVPMQDVLRCADLTTFWSEVKKLQLPLSIWNIEMQTFVFQKKRTHKSRVIYIALTHSCMSSHRHKQDVLTAASVYDTDSFIHCSYMPVHSHTFMMTITYSLPMQPKGKPSNRGQWQGLLHLARFSGPASLAYATEWLASGACSGFLAAVCFLMQCLDDRLSPCHHTYAWDTEQLDMAVG